LTDFKDQNQKMEKGDVDLAPHFGKLMFKKRLRNTELDLFKFVTPNHNSGVQTSASEVEKQDD
jgi:hypothetical protein